MAISTFWILKYVQQCYVKWFWTISSLGAPGYSQLFFPHPRTLSSFVLILSANLIQWSIIPFCWYAPATNANFFFLCTLIYYNSSIRITTKYFHKGRNKIEPLLHAKISGENHLISYYIYKLSISNSSLPGLFLSQKLVKRLTTL